MLLAQESHFEKHCCGGRTPGFQITGDSISLSLNFLICEMGKYRPNKPSAQKKKEGKKKEGKKATKMFFFLDLYVVAIVCSFVAFSSKLFSGGWGE